MKAPARHRKAGVRVMVLQPSSVHRRVGFLTLFSCCCGFLLRLHGEIILAFIENGASYWAYTSSPLLK